MKRLMLLLAVGVLCLGAWSEAVAAKWPDRPITVVVPYGPAGSSGMTARLTAPFLGKYLGTQVNIINKPGAGTMVGLEFFQRQKQDGSFILCTTISPVLPNLVVANIAEPKILEAIVPVNGQNYNPYVFVVHKDSPYTDVAQIYERLKKEPLSLAGCGSQGGAGHMGHFSMLDAFGVPHNNLRLVIFQTGNESMAAIMGRQVDFGLITSLVAERMRDSIRVLAVMDKLPSERWPGVPVINDALKQSNTSIVPLPGSMVGWAVSKEFTEKYPDRYATLVKALEAVTRDEEAQAALAKGNIGYAWFGPEKTKQIMLETLEVLRTENKK